MSGNLDTEKFRKRLIRERERLLQERKAASENGEGGAGELADYDNHPADAASETFERTKDYALEENFRVILERIDEALRKIDSGTYGVCDRCGESINPERLKAIPYATMCVSCQEIVERG